MAYICEFCNNNYFHLGKCDCYDAELKLSKQKQNPKLSKSTTNHPKFIFLTLNFSCNDNNIFEDFISKIATDKSLSHFNPTLKFYSIEHDDTPNKHFHSLYKSPNQSKPENYKRSLMTQYNKYMHDKYHTTEASISINFQVISNPETVIQKREYIFKDYSSLKRFNCEGYEPEQLYKAYWEKKEIKKSDTFYDIPIISLKSNTILRHTIDFYLRHIEDYPELIDLKNLYAHMLKHNYSFICCSKYVKEQTIYEIACRYFNQNINIINNNIYDTEHKSSFHSDNIFRTVSRILWSILPIETQKQVEDSPVFSDLFKHPSQFIEDELEM